MALANLLRKGMGSSAILLAVLLGAGDVAWGNSLAQIHTPLGEVLVELYDEDKPATVANFQRYIREGRFDETFVQRWEPGFVIQGGGYYVNAESKLAPVETFGAITNEYSVGRTFSNTYGSMAMARSPGGTNSATSQWFFNLGNNAFLDSVDGGFTVFGQVRIGTNVLNRFNNTAVSNGIFVVNLGGALSTLPVLSRTPTPADLIYTGMSLPAWPRVQIESAADGRPTVVWNSLSNFVNRVEYSAGGFGAWQTLETVTGTGAEMRVTDPQPPPASRFYRVVIE